MSGGLHKRGGRGAAHNGQNHGGLFNRAGGRRQRLFRGGDLKLVVLDIIQQAPVHGYEIIKALEELVGGGYSPSPGTIYPTLNTLEESGYASAREAAGRKEYSVTPEGKAFLRQNKTALTDIHQRLSVLKHLQDAKNSAEIQRAMENLKTAIWLKFSEEELHLDEIRRIADLLDRTAVAIERGEK